MPSCHFKDMRSKDPTAAKFGSGQLKSLTYMIIRKPVQKVIKILLVLLKATRIHVQEQGEAE